MLNRKPVYGLMSETELQFIRDNMATMTQITIARKLNCQPGKVSENAKRANIVWPKRSVFKPLRNKPNTKFFDAEDFKSWH